MGYRRLRFYGEAADSGKRLQTAEEATLSVFNGRCVRMNGWTESLAFSIVGAALLLSLMGLWFTAILPGIDRWTRHFFICYFMVFMLCCLSGIVEILFQYHQAPETVFRFLLLLENLLLSLPVPMLTVYLRWASSS